MSHTPGPWHLLGHGMAQCLSNTTGAEWSQDRHFVARLETSSDANARLIAASPDLFALLREIAPDVDCQCGSGVPVPCWRCRADEVLRAVEG